MEPHTVGVAGLPILKNHGATRRLSAGEKFMRLATIVLLGLVLLTALGCSGTPLRLPTAPLQANEEVIGPVSGSATGIMLFQFIPIGQNDRFNAAYQRALLSKSDATRIVDITIQENWFWAWLLNGYSFHLNGTAVRTR